MKKAQLSLEFMSLIIMGVIIAIVLLVGFSVYLQDTREAKQYEKLKDYGFQLQEELIMASRVHEGYRREIAIPNKLGTFDLEVNNTETRLLVSSGDVEFPLPIPKVNGTFRNGTNIIMNRGGEIVIE